MSLRDKGTVYKINGKSPTKVMIYVPRTVSSDSRFPFKSNDKVIVQISGNRLIIKKV